MRRAAFAIGQHRLQYRCVEQIALSGRALITQPRLQEAGLGSRSAEHYVEQGIGVEPGKAQPDVVASPLLEGGHVARLVIVSNRVPLPSERRPRAGGLAV